MTAHARKDGLIDATKIPGATIDIAGLRSSAAQFTATAAAIDAGATAVVGAWQPLQHSYVTDQTADLMAAMAPVTTDSATYVTFISGLGTAVDTLADEVEPHVKKLGTLIGEAAVFADSVSKGVEVPMYGSAGPSSGRTSLVDWDTDENTVAANKKLLHRVNVEVAAILQAQARFQDKVRAHENLCFAPPLRPTAKQLDAATDLPWGRAVDRKKSCGESFDDGIGDAVGDTFKGLGTLVFGVNQKTGAWWDGDSYGAAWGGLGNFFAAAGMGLAMTPYSIAYATGNLDQLPADYKKWDRDNIQWVSDHYMPVVEGFVGSDEEWKNDPAYASGKLAFNLATILLPTKGVGAFAKAGLGVKVAELATKAADVVGGLGKAGELTLAAGRTVVHAADALNDLVRTAHVHVSESIDRAATAIQRHVDDLASRLALHKPAFAGGDVPSVTHPAPHDPPGTISASEHPGDASHPLGEHPATGADPSPAGAGGDEAGRWKPSEQPDPLANVPPDKLEQARKLLAIAGNDHVPTVYRNFAEGNLFNYQHQAEFVTNEVYVHELRAGADGHVILDGAGRPEVVATYRIDSLNQTVEVVERKATQLSEISERTALTYIKSFETKYVVDDERFVIADVPSARANPDLAPLIGQQLQGAKVLQIPVQVKPIPPEILEYAADHGVTIRDVAGHEY
jgi:polyhydroxyalkanoate synthesis regulator phasin